MKVATLALASALATAAGPALAVLECHYYDDFVAEAVMILQIRPTAVEAPRDDSFDCRIAGEIVRAFKGPHPVGTMVETRIPCLGFPVPEGVELDIPIGATIFRDWDALTGAAVIELHIAPEGGPAGAGAGVVLLEAPTEAPAYTSFCD